MIPESVTTFVEFRRVGGFKYCAEEGLLRSFARFASERGDTHVRTQTAIDWAARGSSPVQREARLRIVVTFARHCRAVDSAHDVPPTGVFGSGRHRRPVAYVFSQAEVRRIIGAALELAPKASLRPHTYYTLLGLLAATGLRIGEALRLRIDDITPDGLEIRETKFRKSRLVPLHTTTTKALQRYLDLRSCIGVAGGHVFVDLHGQPLKRNAVATVFQELIVKVGLPGVRHGLDPRLHDMRHTWAARALAACPSNRGQVDQHTRAVMTYLGHANVASGYWYLHNTPSLKNRIADACAAQEDQDRQVRS